MAALWSLVGNGSEDGESSLKESVMRVAVLMGGVSREREVSLKSGRAVAQALGERGHKVELYDLCEEKLPVWRERPEVVFLALHGGWGENGGVQEALERQGIPYTGSSAPACRLAMDKVLSKVYFRRAGLDTPSYILVTVYWPRHLICEMVQHDLGYPVVLKPPREGSSIGVELAKNEEELLSKLERLFGLSEEVMIEKYVAGREFTASILGDALLPLVEIRKDRPLFDYEAKYQGGVSYSFPRLSEKEEDRIFEAAWRAHQALGCQDVSRVDLILTEEGRTFVLEVNALPGLTERSLLPLAAKQVGMDLGELCELLCHLAKSRGRVRKCG